MGPLLIFSISLEMAKRDRDGEGDGLDMVRETEMAEGRWRVETKK